MEPFSWKCPFCNQNATIQSANIIESYMDVSIDNFLGLQKLVIIFIICPNKDCRKYTLSITLFKAKVSSGFLYELVPQEIIKEWDIIPQSNAKVFPEYVPKAIIADYNEACAIVHLSPKASATLARRCLQGMIRNFFNIKKHRLLEEINAIEDKVDILTWQSIDTVRKIGNIGAHMEMDIDLIIDVDENEADILIRLIEQLIEDWYIARFEREQRLNKIIEIGKTKEEQKDN
jgi:Domain of unknown function (DUF4145)